MFKSTPKKVTRMNVLDTLEDNLRGAIKYYNFMVERVIDGTNPPVYDTETLDTIDIQFYELISSWIDAKYPKKITLQYGSLIDSIVSPSENFEDELIINMSVELNYIQQVNDLIRPGWTKTQPLHCNRYRNTEGMEHLEIYFDHKDIPVVIGYHLPNVINTSKIANFTEILYKDFLLPYLRVCYDNTIEPQIRMKSPFTQEVKHGGPIGNPSSSVNDGSSSNSYFLMNRYSLPIIDILIIEHLLVVAQMNLTSGFSVYNLGGYNFMDAIQLYSTNEETSEENKE